METVQDEAYMKQLGKMERPIPGSSLTNDPENPLPFEGAPEFTKRKDAIESIFLGMTQPETYEMMLTALLNGTTVMNLTQVILFEGFRQGKWNPDLFLILIEPTAYIIMALAERAGVDYVIDNEVDEEMGNDEIEAQFEQVASKINKGGMGKNSAVIPKEIEAMIDNSPAKSLFERPPKEQMETSPSLFSREEV